MHRLNIHCHSLSLSEFIQMALNFEDSRRKWLRLEQDMNACKEVLTKAETERGALEVKLKHARNQVDVEIRRRQKAEADCAKLVCRLLFACSCALDLFSESRLKPDVFLYCRTVRSSSSGSCW